MAWEGSGKGVGGEGEGGVREKNSFLIAVLTWAEESLRGVSGKLCLWNPFREESGQPFLPISTQQEL